MSTAYWGIDRFRIRALQKILKSGLSRREADLVRREITKKAAILADGSLKRGKYMRYVKYKYIASVYGEDRLLGL